MALPSANVRGGILASGASYASDAVPANPDTAVKEDSEAAAGDEEATNTAGKDTYAGAYVGAGLNHQYTIGEALLDDDLDASNGLGDDKVDAHAFSLVNSKVGTLGGTITAGYGIFDDNYYIGADLCVDITGNKDHSQKDDLYLGSKIKTAGVIPTIALRFGRYFSSIDCLAYARFGFTNLRNEFQANERFKTSFRCQSISPIVGLGFEKLVLDKCSVRFECDYRFPANKKKHDLSMYDENGNKIMGLDDSGNLVDNYRGQIENRARGYAVRLMCVYHF